MLLVILHTLYKHTRARVLVQETYMQITQYTCTSTRRGREEQLLNKPLVETLEKSEPALLDTSNRSSESSGTNILKHTFRTQENANTIGMKIYTPTCTEANESLYFAWSLRMNMQCQDQKMGANNDISNCVN